MASIIDHDAAGHAMIEGLTDLIRNKLRERILEKIEPDIKAAIDAAMEEFKLTVGTWKDPQYMRDTIKVLIEHRNDPRR